MNEPDLFIVTIIFGDENSELDMELPSQLSIGELRIRIFEILKNLHEDVFEGWHSCGLEFKNRVLEDNETLLKAGVFDGSRLYVVETD